MRTSCKPKSDIAIPPILAFCFGRPHMVRGRPAEELCGSALGGQRQ